MKLARIRIAGFRGFREQIEIAVDEGFLIITGRNGAGKSSICDAIEFGLTGTLARFATDKSKEKGETVGDYIWWRGEGEPQERVVELVFRTDDGELASFSRRPGDPDGAAPGLAEYFCASHADPRPVEELVRTMLLRDETIASFSIDLPETERFAAVERALGLTGPMSREAIVLETTSLINARLGEAKRRYDGLRERVLQLTGDVAQRRSESTSSTILARAEADLRTELNIEEGVIDIGSVQQNLAKIRAVGRQVELDYHELLEVLRHRDDINWHSVGPEAEAARRSAEKVEEEITLISATLEEVENVISEQERRANTNALWIQLAKAGAELGRVDGNCPLCSSSISEAAFSDQLARIERGLSQDADAYASALSRKRELEAALSDVRRRRDRAREFVTEIQRAVDGANARVAELKVKVGEETGITDVTPDAIAEWLGKRSASASRIEAALTVMATAKRIDRLTDFEEELAAVSVEAEVAASALSKLTRAAEDLKVVSRTIREVTKEVTDERLAAASPVLEELYRRLRPHSEWRDVSYSVRGTVKKMLTFRVGDGLNPKFVFSSGQRRAAGLAFLLAVHLARNWCRLNTLILDDPVQHIDDFRALHLVEVLSAIRKTGRQIICTVEDSALADLLLRRLQVEPLSGGAKIELRSDPLLGSVVQSHIRAFALPQNILLSA